MSQCTAAITKAFDMGFKDLDELLSWYPNELLDHSRRVAASCAAIAEHAGIFVRKCDMPGNVSFSTVLYLGGLCHDAGKLLAPPEGGGVCEDRLHPLHGAELIEKSVLVKEADVAKMLWEIAAYHHERPDGTGYPAGVKGRHLSLAAAICAVANELDHMIFDSETPQDPASLLERFRAGSKIRYCASAVVCLERAWGSLCEQYAGRLQK